MKKNYLLIFFLALTFYSYGQNDEIPNLVTSQILNIADEIKGFKMYPNPVTDGILKISTLENAERKVQIFDVLGKEVLSRTITSQHLLISRLNAGIYIVKVSEQGKTATRKLVIK